MPERLDLTNERFGKLWVLVEKERSANYGTKWLCLCECGTDSVVTTAALRSGKTQSCGCLVKTAAKKVGIANSIMFEGYTHVRHPLYDTWQGMKTRCTNQNHIHYKNYGGRGITVCDEWVDTFEQFVRDMGDRPEGYTLDRRNNNGNYTPDNCRWATILEQNRNRRNSRSNHA